MRDGKTKRQTEPEMKVDAQRLDRSALQTKHNIWRFSGNNSNTLPECK